MNEEYGTNPQKNYRLHRGSPKKYFLQSTVLVGGGSPLSRGTSAIGLAAGNLAKQPILRFPCQASYSPLLGNAYFHPTSSKTLASLHHGIMVELTISSHGLMFQQFLQTQKALKGLYAQ